MKILLVITAIIVMVLLCLSGIIYLKMDYCEVVSTKIVYDRYRFDQPMSFSKAIQYFEVDSVSRRTALRYDERGWLNVKVIQNYWDQSIFDSDKLLISGVNFYFDDTLSVNKELRKLEIYYKKTFKSDNLTDYKGNVEATWKSMELNCQVTIISYRFNPTFNNMGEKEYGVQAKNKQWVLAFVFNEPPKFMIGQYVQLDGLTYIP